MGKMFFYDIMMLYRRWEAFAKEENEQQETQQQEYENRMQDNMGASDMMREAKNLTSNFSMPSFDAGSITKGFQGFH